MGLMVVYRGRRFGRYSNATFITLAFFLLWTFREPLRLDRVGLDDSLVPWMPRPPQDAFDFEPVDSDAIRAVCAATQWDTAKKMQVVFTCDNNVGGTGNTRNSILNCVRYAMLAGGSLVMPRIFVRNDSDIPVIRTGKREGLEYMFDRDHFIRSLNISCPQLRLFNTTDDVHRALGPPRTWTLGLFPESLVEEDKISSTGISHPEKWRSLLYDWLYDIDDNIDVAPTGKSKSIEGPMIVDLGRSYLTYPIRSDGEEFANTFGSILKSRSDIRRLATTTILNIQRPFFGAHLRTEKDALDGWNPGDLMSEWSDYGRQIDVYLDQAARFDLSTVYVASGNQTQAAAFATEAREKHGVSVVTKADLLRGKDRKSLEALTWDQRAMVDFLVMMGATQFGGVGQSGFAWAVALRRHLFAQEKGRHLDGPQILSDDLSQIYGKQGKYPEYAACMWP